MSAWTAFGFGLLIGSLIFDQLWRHLRRLESRLRERGGAGYYTQADLDAQWERVRHYDFSPPARSLQARRPTLVPKDIPMTDTPLSDDVVELCARVIERQFYEYVDDPPMPGSKPFEHIARAALEAARYGEMVEEHEGLKHDFDRLADCENHYVNQCAKLEEGLRKIVALIDRQGCNAVEVECADIARTLLSSIGASHE